MLRIISQNKKFDIPYHQAMLATWRLKDGSSSVTANVNGTEYMIGSYSNPSKASAVMEAINRAYFHITDEAIYSFFVDEALLDELATSVRRNANGDILFTLPKDV